MATKLPIKPRPKSDGRCDTCGDQELVKWKTTGILANSYACVNCREMAKSYR